MKDLDKYKLAPKLFSKYLKDVLEFHDPQSFKKNVAKLSLQLLEEYSSNKINKKNLKDIFLFLQLYIDDHFPSLDEEGSSFYDLLYDGVVFDSPLPDYGERVLEMKKAAQKILKNS